MLWKEKIHRPTHINATYAHIYTKVQPPPPPHPHHTRPQPPTSLQLSQESTGRVSFLCLIWQRFHHAAHIQMPTFAESCHSLAQRGRVWKERQKGRKKERQNERKSNLGQHAKYHGKMSFKMWNIGSYRTRLGTPELRVRAPTVAEAPGGAEGAVACRPRTQ